MCLDWPIAYSPVKRYVTLLQLSSRPGYSKTAIESLAKKWFPPCSEESAINLGRDLNNSEAKIGDGDENIGKILLRQIKDCGKLLERDDTDGPLDVIEK